MSNQPRVPATTTRVPLLPFALPLCLAASPEWPTVVLIVWLTLPLWVLWWLDVRDRWHRAADERRRRDGRDDE
jgi:hypothetical protein